MHTLPPEEEPRAHLRSLTSLRFYAALLVVLYHFFMHFEPMAFTAPVVGLGYIGVSFFFVLSGFVLAWSQKPSESRQRFFLHRFARVWPLHAFTTALAIPVYVVVGIPLLWEALPFVLTLTHAWVPPAEYHYAFNSPSWSLACEAFFYLMFPFLIGPIRKQRRVVAVLGIAFASMALAGVAGLAFVPASAREYLFYSNPAFRLGEFVIGICLAVLIQRGWRPRFTLGQALSVTAMMYAVLMAATLARYESPRELPFFVADLWMVPAFAAVIVSAATRDVNGTSGFLGRTLAVRLGMWSFALYLVHELLIRLFSGTINSLGMVAGVAASILVLVISVATSWALYEHFERPVEKRIRHWGAARSRATQR